MAGDIAIVGFSIKLPQIQDASSFWETLQEGKNLMTEWPKARINADAFLNHELEKRNKIKSRGGYFVKDDPGAFDAPFFSITAAEAASMDPMQRWTLETSYRAFENAGIPLEKLRGSRTAVFSASMTDDWSRMLSKDPEIVPRTAITGSFASILPNRVSWFFDLQGPSVHVDTACSSSLIAVDLACQSIAGGDATMALVTGANLILGPDGFMLLSNLNFLSPDSKSYSFDHRANGYARGEGAIALVLKPFRDALRDGDTVRAVIRSTGSNQDGRTPSLTQPSPEAQEALIRHVYKKANLSLASTRYVEAHGTGTPVGDPIEMKAIGRVFRRYRSAEDPLYVGSVKSNIGHLEGCSGLAGMIKSILMLEKGIIVPNALLERMNSDIDIDFYHTVVPTKNLVWPTAGLRRISINSFGFGGSNAHVVLDDAYNYLQDHLLPLGGHVTTPSILIRSCFTSSKTNGAHYVNGANNASLSNGHRSGFEKDYVLQPYASNGSPNLHPIEKNGKSGARLLVWSAADEKALERTIQGYKSYVQDHIKGDRIELDKLAYTLACRRSKMSWRTYAITEIGQSSVKTQISVAKSVRMSADLGVAFVFTGQGAQYVGMGSELLQYPIYERFLRHIDTTYKDLGCEWSIFDELQSAENIDKPEFSQPLLTGLQIALVELLRFFGINPKAVVGHSSGEIAAAYTIGAISLKSACKISYFRGKLAGRLRAKSNPAGAMMSVNLPYSEVAAYLHKIGTSVENSISVACINSPINCTLSGPEVDLDVVKQRLDEDSVFAQKLKTGVAYHSSFMSTIADEYRSQMGILEVESPKSFGGSIPMVSTVTGELLRPSTLADPDYWVANLVSPVRFSDAIQAVSQRSSTLKLGLGSITDLIEVGPHSALKRPIQDTVLQAGNRNHTRYISVLHRTESSIQMVLGLLGHLFSHGYAVNVSEANHLPSNHSSQFLTDLPEYPFDRSHVYWDESRLSRDFRLRESTSGDLLGSRCSDWNPLDPRWRNFWSAETTPWLADHVISNTTIFPAAGMLIMAMEAVREMARNDRQILGYFIKEAQFISPIIVNESWEQRTETMLHLRPVQKPYEKESVWSDIRIFVYRDRQWSECFKATIQVQYEESDTQVDQVLERALEKDRVLRIHDQASKNCLKRIESQRFYVDSADHGVKYGKWFQVLEDIRCDGVATSVANAQVTRERHASLVHPAVLDSAFHVLRVSLTKGLTASSTTQVPVSLHDAWFAASGWQTPKTFIRYVAIASKDPSQEAIEGSIYAFGDGDSVLCKMSRLVTANVAKKDQLSEVAPLLLHEVVWQPQLTLLEPNQLQQFCSDKIFGKDETLRISSYDILTSILNKVVSLTLQALNDDERRRIPQSMKRHLAWMEHHVKQTPSFHSDINISDMDLEKSLDEIEVLHPPWKLFASVARQLKHILLGEVDPLSVIFESHLAEVFYADMFKSICDKRLERFIELASHENSQLRILEVGAGTGGMTSHILSTLLGLEATSGGLRFSNYTFTDISPTFFEAAQARWHTASARMTFKTLDLERPIEDQEIGLSSYDLVIAGSVLHATKDLAATIQNVRRTLKSGGQMILLEAIAPEKVITNFAFGLAPGWWNCEEEWRRLSPTIVEDQWHECLKANGFSGNDLCLRDYQSDSCHIFSIIITTAKDEPGDYSQCSSQTVFFIVDTTSDYQINLANILKRKRETDLNTPKVQIIPLEPLKEQAAIRDEDIVVSLIETDRAFLSIMSEEQFEALRNLIRLSKKLLWVTSPSSDDGQFALYGIAAGFFRSIRTEAIEKHLVTLTIESEIRAVDHDAYHIDKVLKTSFEQRSTEVEYVVRADCILTARVAEKKALNSSLRSLLQPQRQYRHWSSDRALQLVVDTPGSLDSLEYVEDVNFSTPLGPQEVEIEAKAWGVNFRDVYMALGRLTDGALGGDCAGVVTRVGSDCAAGFQIGNRVCVLSQGCMKSHPRAAGSQVIKIPSDLSFVEAASAVVPAVTAYYSLVDVARLLKGEKVLIHSAAGATGQMAIWIAKARGAEIFATVGSDEKKQFLIDKFQIPSDHIFYSRNTLFKEGILRVTEGSGVNVVLNSLSGDGLRASWECIAPYGRFIEIGKADIMANSLLPMAGFAKNATFSAVDLVHMLQSDANLINRLLRKTFELLERGAQHPKPLHIYSVSQVEQAFRYLQSGANIGRIVIDIELEPSQMVPQRIVERRDWQFNRDASYLIVGGFGGLGRAILRWMVGRGAKHLAILSRGGPVTLAASELVADLETKGVTIFAPRCDVSSVTSLASVLEELRLRGMPPIKGCINAAMVLQDSVFDNMTHEQWSLTINSKIHSSWNLHKLLPTNMDFFILLSSLAGICGTVAQSNYAGGCSAQDALARYRTGHGQKALSVDVGWMRNIGIIAEKESYRRNRQQAGDMRQIEDTELMALLTIYCDPDLPLLSGSESQILLGLLTPADFLSHGQTVPQTHDQPLFKPFSHIVGETTTPGSQVIEDAATLFRLAKETDERGQIVIRALSAKLARAMSISADEVEASKPLSSYGVDSLMAVELRNYIEREFQARVAVFDIMGGVPIATIGDLVAERSRMGKEKENGIGKASMETDSAK
ncbi:hypothetical protein F5Y16DRAFT_420447 [Xylariaceae sp. FL0255]|nr:hypothetical protein F5Y16DRAFT_420447 [Xylariaceae sp. FL0255]